MLNNFFLCLTGVLLLTLGCSWHTEGFFGPIFFAFVPFLILLDKNTHSVKKYLIVYLGLSIWTFRSTLFTYDNNAIMVIFGTLILSFYFLIPFILYGIVRKKKGNTIGLLIFILSYVSIEFLNYNWEFGVPFLTLGNTFGAYPSIIQWYEFTGALGGSLWILLINALVFLSYLRYKESLGWSNKIGFLGLSIILALVVPITSSYFISIGEVRTGNEKSLNLVVIHTNADNHNFKYSISSNELADYTLNTTLPNLSQNTDLILWPETAIRGNHWINNNNNNIRNNHLLNRIRDSIKSISPNANLISGIFLKKRVLKNKRNKYSSHFNKKKKYWFYRYNGITNISTQNDFSEYRTKQVMVPLEESVPYPEITSYLFGWVHKSFRKSYFYSEKENGKVLKTNSGIKLASLICYESLFGEEFTKYTRNGAELIFMSLNEGWYKNPEILEYTRNLSVLRAIENRKYIARSSNDGISCVIDEHGNILNEISEFSPGAIKARIFPNKKRTFYAKHGDYIGLISLGCLSVLLLITLMKRILFYKKRPQNSVK